MIIKVIRPDQLIIALKQHHDEVKPIKALGTTGYYLHNVVLTLCKKDLIAPIEIPRKYFFGYVAQVVVNPIGNNNIRQILKVTQRVKHF